MRFGRPSSTFLVDDALVLTCRGDLGGGSTLELDAMLAPTSPESER